MYSGLNIRKIQNRNTLSFEADIMFDSLDGSGVFGFSGEGNLFSFKFKKGKIYDPKDRYIFSYSPDNQVNFSGNISESFYDYYINDVIFCKDQSKAPFKIENFFIHTFDVKADLSVYVNGSGSGSFDIRNLPQEITSGLEFSGEIFSQEGGAFDIFSAQFGYPFSNSEITQMTNLPLRIENGGINYFKILSNESIINKNYNIKIDFETSFGFHQKEFPISGYKQNVGYFFNSSSRSSDFKEETELYKAKSFTGIKEKNSSIEQKLFIDGSGPILGLPELITFKYASGITGLVSGIITGFSLENGGSGYLTNTLIKAEEASLNSSCLLLGIPNRLGSITGVSVLNVGSGYSGNINLDFSFNVTGVNVLNSGSGYFSSPNFLISGTDGYPSSGRFLVDTSGRITKPVFHNVGSGFFSEPDSVIIYSVLSGINIVNPGSGFTNNFDLTFSGGGGSGIQASGLVSFKVSDVSITNSGFGYESVPSVVFSGDEILPASGEASMLNGKINTVSIINSGLYKSKPIISFSGGNPSSIAKGKSITEGNVTGVLITDRGNNFINNTEITYTAVGSGAIFQSVMSSGASMQPLFSSGAAGVGVKGSYFKSFRDSFNLYTGVEEDDLLDFKENDLFNEETQSFENNIIYLGSNNQNVKVKITHSNSYDDFPLVGLLTVSGSGNNFIYERITGLR